MNKEIEIAYKMQKCRDTATRFFRDEYIKKTLPYKNIIKAHQNKFNLDVLPSVLELCSFESVRDNEMAIILFMSAALDLIET